MQSLVTKRFDLFEDQESVHEWASFLLRAASSLS